MLGNQLLDSDVFYVKDPIRLFELNNSQLKKLAIVTHYSFNSTNYCIFLLLEMERRNIIPFGRHQNFIYKITEFK